METSPVHIPGLDKQLDSGLLQRYITNTLDVPEWEKLDPAAKEALKQARKVPMIDPFLDGIDLLEFFTEYGRVAAMSGQVRPILKKYGDEKLLKRNFEKEIGADAEVLKKAEAILRQFTGENTRFVRGSLVTLDDMGEGGKVCAYMWPYVGLQGFPATTDLSDELINKSREKLLESGIHPWRVGQFDFNPGARTQRGATLAVFYGK